MGSLYLPPQQGLLLIGSLIGANFNTTADQPIAINLPPGTRYRVNNIFISRPSISLTTAAGGIYTGASKSGLAVMPASTTYTALTTNAVNTVGSLTGGSVALAIVQADTLFFSLTTAQGAAATADIHIVGMALQ